MILKKNLKKIIPIILAAGRGSRIKKLTRNKPKSLIKIRKNFRLIDQILDNFNNNNLSEPYLISGYQNKKFKKIKNIKIINNDRWKNTNITGSLLKVLNILRNNTCIISYSDIYYEKDAIKILKKDKRKNCILLLSNKNWKKYWFKRFYNPLRDLESFKINKKNQLIEIGSKVGSLDEIQGQYMGLLRTNPSIWNKIIFYFKNNLKKFEKFDITQFLNFILTNKICPIYVINYKKKWYEIDNYKDYQILKNSFRI